MAPTSVPEPGKVQIVQFVHFRGQEAGVLIVFANNNEPESLTKISVREDATRKKHKTRIMVLKYCKYETLLCNFVANVLCVLCSQSTASKNFQSQITSRKIYFHTQYKSVADLREALQTPPPPHRPKFL